MDNNHEDLKLFSDIVVSLTETKKELLKCLTDEKIDDKLKRDMFKHLKKIDNRLLNGTEVIYGKVYKEYFLQRIIEEQTNREENQGI